MASIHPEKTCSACRQPIDPKASICPSCRSQQAKFLRISQTVSTPISLVISIVAFLASMFALYNSNQPQSANPRIEGQAVGFRDNDFSYLIYNVGSAPSILQSVDLHVSLQQGDGRHILKASFDLAEEILLQPGESTQITIPYADYVERRTTWEVSDPSPDDFSLGFMYVAAGLGNNLNCGLVVGSTKPDYYNYIGGSTVQTNGNCSDAMKWFAKEIGPLAAEG